MGWFTTLLELLGLVSIVAGVAFIFWPAALIVAGIGALWLAREIERQAVK